MSSTRLTRLVRNTWPRPDSGWGRTSGVRRQCSTNAGGALCKLTRRNWSPSVRSKLANLAAHRRVAFANIASKTGCSSPGDLLMTCSTSEVAVCRSKCLGDLAGARLHLVEQPYVLDRDHCLIGKGRDEFNLL